HSIVFAFRKNAKAKTVDSSIVFAFGKNVKAKTVEPSIVFTYFHNVQPNGISSSVANSCNRTKLSIRPPLLRRICFYNFRSALQTFYTLTVVSGGIHLFSL